MAKHLVAWRRPYWTDDDTLRYDSKCGKYGIEKVMMADLGGRAGYFTTPEYRLSIAGKSGETKHDSLYAAKLQADWNIDPNWDPDEEKP